MKEDTCTVNKKALEVLLAALISQYSGYGSSYMSTSVYNAYIEIRNSISSVSSVGRALPLQGIGRPFEPDTEYQDSILEDKIPEAIYKALLAMLGSDELVKRWWVSPNLAFNKLCPRDSDQREVRRYILGYLLK